MRDETAEISEWLRILYPVLYDWTFLLGAEASGTVLRPASTSCAQLQHQPSPARLARSRHSALYAVGKQAGSSEVSRECGVRAAQLLNRNGVGEAGQTPCARAQPCGVLLEALRVVRKLNFDWTRAGWEFAGGARERRWCASLHLHAM